MKFAPHEKGIDPNISSDHSISASINLVKILNVLGCNLGHNVVILRRVLKLVSNLNLDK
jgi:hypothetical protein